MTAVGASVSEVRRPRELGVASGPGRDYGRSVARWWRAFIDILMAVGSHGGESNRSYRTSVPHGEASCTTMREVQASRSDASRTDPSGYPGAPSSGCWREMTAFPVRVWRTIRMAPGWSIGW